MKNLPGEDDDLSEEDEEIVKDAFSALLKASATDLEPSKSYLLFLSNSDHSSSHNSSPSSASNTTTTFTEKSSSKSTMATRSKRSH